MESNPTLNRNNVEFMDLSSAMGLRSKTNFRVVQVIISRDINKGEELFIDYGSGYVLDG